MFMQNRIATVLLASLLAVGQYACGSERYGGGVSQQHSNGELIAAGIAIAVIPALLYAHVIVPLIKQDWRRRELIKRQEEQAEAFATYERIALSYAAGITIPTSSKALLAAQEAIKKDCNTLERLFGMSWEKSADKESIKALILKLKGYADLLAEKLGYAVSDEVINEYAHELVVLGDNSDRRAALMQDLVRAKTGDSSYVFLTYLDKLRDTITRCTETNTPRASLEKLQELERFVKASFSSMFAQEQARRAKDTQERKIFEAELAGKQAKKTFYTGALDEVKKVSHAAERCSRAADGIATQIAVCNSQVAICNSQADRIVDAVRQESRETRRTTERQTERTIASMQGFFRAIGEKLGVVEAHAKAAAAPPAYAPGYVPLAPAMPPACAPSAPPMPPAAFAPSAPPMPGGY